MQKRTKNKNENGSKEKKEEIQNGIQFKIETIILIESGAYANPSP